MERGESSFEIEHQGQMGGRISDADGQGVGGPESWTIPMDVICVSSQIWMNEWNLYLSSEINVNNIQN